MQSVWGLGPGVWFRGFGETLHPEPSALNLGCGFSGSAEVLLIVIIQFFTLIHVRAILGLY